MCVCVCVCVCVFVCVCVCVVVCVFVEHVSDVNFSTVFLSLNISFS